MGHKISASIQRFKGILLDFNAEVPPPGRSTLMLLASNAPLRLLGGRVLTLLWALILTPEYAAVESAGAPLFWIFLYWAARFFAWTLVDGAWEIVLKAARDETGWLSWPIGYSFPTLDVLWRPVRIGLLPFPLAPAPTPPGDLYGASMLAKLSRLLLWPPSLSVLSVWWETEEPRPLSKFLYFNISSLFSWTLAAWSSSRSMILWTSSLFSSASIWFYSSKS